MSARARVNKAEALLIRAGVPVDQIESYAREFSGMLGDLGLYIPIVVALSQSGQIDLGSTLITTGLCNILTGFVFKSPMCVQPMKSIAAAAITYKLTESEIMASGLLTSFTIFFLGVTGLIELVNMLIPHAAVRGLQIGLGIKLFLKALQMLPAQTTPDWTASAWLQWDGYLLAALSLVFCLVANKSKKVPTAFVLFLAGVVVAATRMAGASQPFSLQPTVMHVVSISSADWARGAVLGAIPQVPTTLLNSCIAVVKLNHDLYPDSQTGVTLTSVACSVGLMNMVFCWFGGHPMCHGSGGLAAQHRFGARTNLSIIVLGLSKLFLGLFFGAGLVNLLAFFPSGILASLLAVASLELAISGRSGLAGSLEEARICVLTACFTAFWGQAEGIGLGIVCSGIVSVADMYVGSAEDTAQAREANWAHAAKIKAALRKVGRGGVGRGEGGVPSKAGDPACSAAEALSAACSPASRQPLQLAFTDATPVATRSHEVSLIN